MNKSEVLEKLQNEIDTQKEFRPVLDDCEYSEEDYQEIKITIERLIGVDTNGEH